MSFKVTKKVRAPKSFGKEGLRRVRAAGKLAGRAVAAGLQEEVVKRIPRGQRWLDLYREAIQYLEARDGNSWSVAGLSRTALTTLPADRTLLKIIGDSTAARIMAEHNPWTVDMLPGMAGGVPGDAEGTASTISNVQAHRKRLMASRASVLDRLREARVQLTDDTPEIAGELFIDLPFLQLAIEHGLLGFPRVPHWTPAARQAANKAKGWVTAEQAKIKAVLAGGRLPRAEHEMPKPLEKRLAKRREATWP